ncbi:hypothetical protein N7528_002829 [Penicillium herquei]|nr:hypothetical protein N7528_002829 [Penicillium herquei]
MPSSGPPLILTNSLSASCSHGRYGTLRDIGSWTSLPSSSASKGQNNLRERNYKLQTPDNLSNYPNASQHTDEENQAGNHDNADSSERLHFSHDTPVPVKGQISPGDSEHNEQSSSKISDPRPVVAAGLGNAALHGLYEKDRRRKQSIGGPILVSASRASTPDDEQMPADMQGSSEKDYESIVTSFGADDFQSLMLRWTTLEKGELDQMGFSSGFNAWNVPSFEPWKYIVLHNPAQVYGV